MNPERERLSQAIIKLVDIMTDLRAPDGCPWDRQQTAASLKPYILEETYELLEALDDDDPEDIRDELGDLLLQVVFQAQIHRERELFDLADIAATISAKLIRRHPHVFADADRADHARRWEEIKQQERQKRGKKSSLSERIPKTLPALQRAAKVVKKTGIPDVAESLDTALQQLERLKGQDSACCRNPEELENAIADMLYLLVQFCVARQLNPEDLLRKKTTQVIRSIDAEKHSDQVKNSKLDEK